MWTNSRPPGASHPRDPLEQRLVVAHVLEHLDRDDAVEPAPSGRTSGMSARDDLDVAQAALARPAPSMKAFCDPRVRHGHDRALAGSARPSRASASPSRSPSSRMRCPSRQLRAVAPSAPSIASSAVGQRRRRPRPERAAVLQPRPEDADEEGRRHFVVLRVGRRRVDRDRADAQRARLRVEGLRLRGMQPLLVVRRALRGCAGCRSGSARRGRAALERRSTSGTGSWPSAARGRTRWSCADTRGTRHRGCAGPAASVGGDAGDVEQHVEHQQRGSRAVAQPERARPARRGRSPPRWSTRRSSSDGASSARGPAGRCAPRWPGWP